MSGQPIFRKGTPVCETTGKLALTKGQAKRAAKDAERKRRRSDIRAAVESYPCDACGKWHVGHLPRWRRGG